MKAARLAEKEAAKLATGASAAAAVRARKKRPKLGSERGWTLSLMKWFSKGVQAAVCTLSAEWLDATPLESKKRIVGGPKIE